MRRGKVSCWGAAGVGFAPKRIFNVRNQPRPLVGIGNIVLLGAYEFRMNPLSDAGSMAVNNSSAMIHMTAFPRRRVFTTSTTMGHC